MAGGGAKKGERRGGRDKGTPNKSTVEKAVLAEAVLVEARAAGRKLGREILDDFASLFSGLAAAHQPLPPNAMPPPGHLGVNEEKFEKWARLAVETAAALAKYQSPTFKAIAVASSLPPNSQEQQQKRPGDDAKVIKLDDPNAVARVYRSIVTASKTVR